ncbi:DUF6473 family protein [Primorskyibacter flagellatus]|uniref:DUF6473 family protein n=1 Tax=Primorskyibacter flagellatus TaxID=1387277 RepID=UPI003A95CABD
MTYERAGRTGLEYHPCRYDNSRILFRGPGRQLHGEYIAFLGGTEIYGRFVRDPVPVLVEKSINRTCINFGTPNAGLDVYLNEPAVLHAAEEAAVTVLQVMGASNMSNRFYSVHPRRNDRFLKASRSLQELYSEVDFTDFNFNRHMLQSLQGLSAERFEIVKEELRNAWLARMRQLLVSLRGRAVLLWFAEHAPEDCDIANDQDPMFVNRAMVEAIRPQAADVIEVVASKTALERRTEGMVFAETDRLAVEELMGPMAHQEAAAAIAPRLSRLLDESQR